VTGVQTCALPIYNIYKLHTFSCVQVLYKKKKNKTKQKIL